MYLSRAEISGVRKQRCARDTNVLDLGLTD
jgi:hypothetical protein